MAERGDMPGDERYIVHADMDAFFAAVEQRDAPELKGRPVIIGADPKGGAGRGVVSTCSYEARVYGVRSAMPISKAYALCPHGIFLHGSMTKYSEVSKHIFEIFREFTPDVEPISVDEAFLDITNSYRVFAPSPVEVCRMIKAEVLKRTELTVSVGMAPIKMAAKIASDLEKPDGLVVVDRRGLLDFLWPMDASRIWGLGPKAREALEMYGIRTIGDIARTPEARMKALFGSAGAHFHRLANGIDARDVRENHTVKSVGNEMTFEEDTGDPEDLAGALLYLCDKVSGRLLAKGLRGRNITLKIRYSDFSTFTRAVTLDRAIWLPDDIYGAIKSLAAPMTMERRPVRLVGVRAAELSAGAVQGTLFTGTSDVKRESLQKAVMEIRGRFGRESITRAGSRNHRGGDTPLHDGKPDSIDD